MRPRSSPTVHNAAADAANTRYQYRRLWAALERHICKKLIESAQNNVIELCTSRVLLAELTRILRRSKFAKAITASGLSIDEKAKQHLLIEIIDSVIKQAS